MTGRTQLFLRVLAFLLLAAARAQAQTEAPHPFSPSAPHSWPANQFQPFCPLPFANPLVGSAAACAANPQSSPQVFDIVLTGNTTWSKPTGLTSGESVLYRFAQDATGGRTVTLPNDGSIIVPNALICTGAGTPVASCLAPNALALTGRSLSVDYVGCMGRGGSAPAWVATTMECLGASLNLASTNSCVWSATQINPNLTGGGSTTVTQGGTTGTYETAFGASSQTTGKFYWETVNNGITSSGDEPAGIGNTSSSVANGAVLGGSADTVGAFIKPSSGSFQIYGGGAGQGQVVGIGAASGDRVAHALDLTNGYYWAQDLTRTLGWIGASTGGNPAAPSGGFNLNGSGVTVLAHPVVPGITVFNTGDTGVGYFASSTWTGTPPSGFASICGQ